MIEKITDCFKLCRLWKDSKVAACLFECVECENGGNLEKILGTGMSIPQTISAGVMSLIGKRDTSGS